jgi:hypothetical protein
MDVVAVVVHAAAEDIRIVPVDIRAVADIVVRAHGK